MLGKVPPENVIKLASAARDAQSLVGACRRILAMAEAGEIRGMAGVMDLGGGVYEYGGEGSFVSNPLLGYAAVARLLQKFS